MSLFGLFAQGMGSSGGASRFGEALGKDKMGTGSRPWDRGMGMQYAQAPVAQQQDIKGMLQGLPTGQQGTTQNSTQQLDQFLAMLMGGAK